MDQACDCKVLRASDAGCATAGIEIGAEPTLVDGGESLCGVLTRQAKLSVDAHQFVLYARLHCLGMGAPRDLDGFFGLGMVDTFVHELCSTFRKTKFDHLVDYLASEIQRAWGDGINADDAEVTSDTERGIPFPKVWKCDGIVIAPWREVCWECCSRDYGLYTGSHNSTSQSVADKAFPPVALLIVFNILHFACLI